MPKNHWKISQGKSKTHTPSQKKISPILQKMSEIPMSDDLSILYDLVKKDHLSLKSKNGKSKKTIKSSSIMEIVWWICTTLQKSEAQIPTGYTIQSIRVVTNFGNKKMAPRPIAKCLSYVSSRLYRGDESHLTPIDKQSYTNSHCKNHWSWSWSHG